jgi:hypothetical protein
LDCPSTIAGSSILSQFHVFYGSVSKTQEEIVDFFPIGLLISDGLSYLMGQIAEAQNEIVDFILVVLPRCETFTILLLRDARQTVRFQRS